MADCLVQGNLERSLALQHEALRCRSLATAPLNGARASGFHLDRSYKLGMIARLDQLEVTYC